MFAWKALRRSDDHLAGYQRAQLGLLRAPRGKDDEQALPAAGDPARELRAAVARRIERELPKVGGDGRDHGDRHRPYVGRVAELVSSDRPVDIIHRQALQQWGPRSLTG